MRGCLQYSKQSKLRVQLDTLKMAKIILKFEQCGVDLLVQNMQTEWQTV